MGIVLILWYTKAMVYKFSINNSSWVDYSGLVNSKQTTIEHNLCTTEFKSAIDKANITLSPSANISLWSSFLSMIIANETIYSMIFNSANELYFYGVLDKSSLDIETKRIPSSCTLSLVDLSTLYLDKQPEEYMRFRNKKVSEIVYALLTKAGMSYTEGGISDTDDITIPAFIVDKEDSDDYRTMIDTLLFECGGYVLDTATNGKAQIKALKWKDDSSTKKVISSFSLSSEGVKTTASILDTDGLKIIYNTLGEKETSVYNGVSSLSQDSDGGLYGDIVKSNEYYPKDGDLEATFQEYDDSLLDRAYNTKISRTKNSDLAIVDVTEPKLTIIAYNYDSENEKVDYSTSLAISDTFEFPVLTSLGMTANPLYYSTKAWILLKNKTSHDVSINHFDITGKALYKDKECFIKIPSDSKNPEEYESSNIYTKEHADKFAQFYWHFKKTSRFISKWKENGRTTSLGDLVIASHKKTNYGQTSLVVSETISFIRDDYIQSSYIAVGVSEWNRYNVDSWGNSSSVGNGKGIKNLVTYYIANNQSTTPSSTDPLWNPQPQEITENNRFLWKKEIATYTDNTQEEKIYLAGVYGATGQDGNFWNFNIEMLNGNIFKTDADVSIWICRVYKNGIEVDSNGSLYNYTWHKQGDSTFVYEKPSSSQLASLGINTDSNKAILIRSQNVGNSSTYYCEVETK